MFQFPASPSCTLWIHVQVTELLSLPGFPIRKSVYHRLFAPTHSLSQLVTSFVGSWCQGIHPTLLVAWPFDHFLLILHLNCFKMFFIFFRQRLRLSIKTIHFLVMYYPNHHFLLDFSNVFSFFTRLSLFSFQGTIFEFFTVLPTYFYIGSPLFKNSMVGLNGIEPSTSRLSGVRSNRLSYKPMTLFLCI